jgi:hypothetical protein
MHAARIRRTVCHLALLTVITGGAAAPRAGEIRLVDASLPAPFLVQTGPAGEPAALDGALEASAVAVVDGGRYWLVAHDKEAPLRLVDPATGRVLPRPVADAAFPLAEHEGGKWEGLARDAAGRIFVVGSHNGKTEELRQAHAYLLSFELGGTGADLTIVPGSLRRWDVAGSLVSALANEGVDTAGVQARKIEGLTIRGAGPSGVPQLVIGLREPDDRVRAFSASLPAGQAAGGSLSLAPLFQFEPGSREGVRQQLTSLEYVPQWAGFLVLTATEDDSNVFHGNTLWFVSDAAIAQSPTVQPQEVARFEVAMKAEGLDVLSVGPGGKTLELVVVYDNDAKKTRIPSRHQRLTLSRE